MNISTKQFKTLLDGKCQRNFGCTIEGASKQQLYKTVCTVIRDLLAEKHANYCQSVQKECGKKVYYMSMEFLTGTSLHNNIYNLGLESIVNDCLDGLSFSIEELYEMEPDAGLGNGGLGRLASCYLDAMTSQNLPATGFSIRYDVGIFKQEIANGWQEEAPDNWLELGGVWLIPHEEDTYEVKFGGHVESYMDHGRFVAKQVDYTTVLATPYDMMISGYDTTAVNELTLWRASSPNLVDMLAFFKGDYMKAMHEKIMAETITKMLYPADDHIEGKRLRLQQQYLLVSASLQSILKSHLSQYASLDSLPTKVAIHINDTHPALCVPELMRLLVDEYSYDWDAAWAICQKTLAYTNHTVMSEALERWPEHLFAEVLPRVHQIVCEINRRLVETLYAFYPGDDAKINYMAVVANGEVRMANLCLACVHKVNGVSQLHSDILTESIFHDYYNISPTTFTNVTNGIAYRRWLCQSNPELTDLLKELIGDGFLRDANCLEDLLKYQDDKEVYKRLQKIKYNNKIRLGKCIEEQNGLRVDPNSIFDVQVKRLHEYKRQLLNVLNILHMYNQIKENPSMVDQMPARTFVFAAKASAAYIMAKRIILLIHAVANMINNDPVAREKIKVVFVPNYRVSLAEIIIPAADISEQISIAGKEASGTGNMKLMINGAVTLGTLDGANVEIHQQVGDENIFLFGLKAHEAEDLWRTGYHPTEFYNRSRNLRNAMAHLTDGSLGTTFDDIYRSLLTYDFGTADAYMTMADFDAYVEAQEKVSATHQQTDVFTKMSLINIAKAGLFSADRAVLQYAENIWDVNAVH